MNKVERQESFLVLDNLIKSKKLTCYALSKELGIAPTVFSDWNSGKSMPKTDKLIKISDYLNVSVDVFIKKQKIN